MEDNNDLMSLFGSTDNEFELNLDGVNPDDSQDGDDNEGGDSGDDNNQDGDDNENNIAGEDSEGSDKVAGDEDPDKGGNEATDDTSPNLYSSFASVLSEEGLLPSLDLENTDIKSIDELTAAFKQELNNQSKSYIIDKLGKDGYDALEKGVSLQDYTQHQENISNIESINEDMLNNDLELSKRIILNDYVNQGMNEDRALRLLKKSIDLGEETIIEDAVESLESLKVFEHSRLEKLKEYNAQQQQEAIVAQEKIDNDLKNSIYNNSNEFIKGLKPSKAVQDKVYTSITKVVGKSPDGIMENQLMQDRRENPIDFDTKLYYIYEMTKGFSDFSKLTGKIQTRNVNSLEAALRQNKFDNTQSSYLQDNESYDGLGSEVVF